MQDLLKESNEENFWSGSLSDVKETSRLLPVVKDTKLSIISVEILNEKEGQPRTWKMIKCTFKLEDGIEVDGVIKNKGSLISETFVYFADPNTYDLTNKFYKTGSFLVPLRQIANAIEYSNIPLIPGGISDGNAMEFAEALKGKIVLGSILQTKEQKKNEEGIYVNTGNLKNEVKNFKKAPDSMLV